MSPSKSFIHDFATRCAVAQVPFVTRSSNTPNVFGPLAALARRTGRAPLAGQLHGPAAPCAIPDPGEDGLAALLARPVGARAARLGG